MDNVSVGVEPGPCHMCGIVVDEEKISRKTPEGKIEWVHVCDDCLEEIILTP